MYKDQKITLVIPCLNEQEGIQLVLKNIPEILDEVLVVDNGSKDRTVEYALKLGAKVIQEDERGYGKAYLRGFSEASGDIIITADGDGTYPVILTPNLVGKLDEENLDFISASRFPLMDQNAMFFRNQIGNRIFAMLIFLLFGIKFKDALSGMWIFRKNILKSLDIKSRGWAFSPELKIEAFSNPQFKCREIKIPYAPRVGDVKLHPYADGWKSLKFLLRKKFGSYSGVIDDRR
jgi:dolichol-phosphate hexosyltransferase